MGGSNMYCTICGGPTCQNLTYEEEEFNDFVTFDELPGVIYDDALWLSHSSVVIYADCLSPPGEYDWGAYCVRAASGDEESDDDVPMADVAKMDPVHRPVDTKSPLGPGRYNCDNTDEPLAHELCIRLAACWAKEAHPDAFPGKGKADPAKYLWDDQGPVCHWACQAEIHPNDDDHDTKAYLAQSKVARKAAGNPSQVDIWRNWSRSFKYGYEMEDEQGWKWLDACGQEYEHETAFGVVHLKRPDCFPAVHDLPLDTPGISPTSLFPSSSHFPADVVLSIVADLDGPGLRALERTSRAWRDFLRCQLAQRHIWLPRVKEFHYAPTDADWTSSADVVRQAMGSPERRAAVDWRRYYNDCRQSSNMKNRARVWDSVWQISHWLDHCGCSKRSDDGGESDA